MVSMGSGDAHHILWQHGDIRRALHVIADSILSSWVREPEGATWLSAWRASP